ncbi:MAG: non-ribosomal peptide synthetase family protein, partial [Anaerolineales bacterium]
SFNVSGAVRLKGTLNISHLRKGLEKIMARHASLRTTFSVIDGMPVQRVHEALPVPLEIIDNTNWSDADLQEFIIRRAHQPFDLENAPAFRVVLIHPQTEDQFDDSKGLVSDGAVLLLAMDHIITDFWSVGVLMRDLISYYQAASSGIPLSIQPLEFQYTDYVHWQRKMLDSPAGDRLLDYWKKELGADLPLLDLPTDRPRPLIQTYRGDSRSIKLSEKMSAGIKNLADSQNVTLFITLLAAFQVLLHRLSGQDEFMVGSVTAGRNQPGLTDLVGYFINPIALRADFSGNPSFNQLLARVRQNVLGAIEHQDYPPALLAEKLSFKRDPSRPPLFETMFILQKAQLAEVSALTPFALGIGSAQLEIGDLVIESLPITNQPAQFDLTLMMAEVENHMAANLHFNTDLFDSSTVSGMLHNFETLFEGILANPDQPVGNIPLLTQAERSEILEAQKATLFEYPKVEGVHQLIEVQAVRTPDSTAVIFEGQTLTYGELNEKANQLANYLRSLGVGPEELVGIYLDRSIDMVVSLLAVLKAGGAYVPLDPAYPRERLEMMMDDSQPLVLLTQERLREALPPQDFQTVSLDRDWEIISGHSDRNPTCEVTPENLAYVIYTSGSTGVPKGVQIPHRAMINFLNTMRDKPGITQEDRLLAVTTLSFDIAALELFLPLTVGAQLEIVSREVASDGARLVEKLAISDATIMQATPATWRMMLEAGWETTKSAGELRILCGGEVLSRDLAEKLLERSSVVWNMYGPTETTVWSTIYQVERGEGPLPIGKPIGNTQVYVLDPNMEPVPAGVVGDLYIGGHGVARGYRNLPNLTAEKFVDDPFPKDKNRKLYKTGDLARWRSDGNLMFLGRTDHQVKIRGYRIELGEIEAALLKHPAFKEVVVVAHEDSAGENKLIAYLVMHDQETELGINDLRGFLRQRLPNYMIPGTFVTLEALPLTPNGKVDRNALPAAPLNRPNLAQEYIPPRNEQEERIAGITGKILGLERVGIHDNFFDLGGNSLSATRLIFQIQEEFEVKLPLVKIFHTPTIAGLSEAIEQARLAPSEGAGIFSTVSIDKLSSEVRLDPSITANGLKYKANGKPTNIFLTGATGFLGAYLLQGLLENTDARIHCLVREVDLGAGMVKLKDNLENYSLWKDEYEQRIIPVLGDLESPWLGLSSEAVKELSDSVDLIYHNGAMVNLVYPYQSHKPANVDGTIEILRFAAKNRIKPVHFISSLSVLHTPNAYHEDILEEDIALDIHGVPLGGYAQSKWVAEKLVQEAGERGIPFTIFRPGPISGHSQDGSWNQDDLMFSLLDAALTLGSAPDLDVILDIVPVDYVADAVIFITSNPDPFGKIYHLSASKRTGFKDVLNHIKQQGYSLKTVSYEQWKRDLITFAETNPGRGWNVYLPLIADVDAQVLHMPRFGQENTKAGLKGSSIKSKPLDRKLLDAYFKYFIESGRIPPPSNKNGSNGS